MTTEASARALCALLTEENEALARMQLDVVVERLARKQALVATLRSERALHDIDRATGRALAVCLARNAALLETAMGAQRRLMSVLAAAARKSNKGETYRLSGDSETSAKCTAIALIALA